MNRDQQIELKTGAERRHEQLATRLSSNEQFRSLLGQYDPAPHLTGYGAFTPITVSDKTTAK